MTRESPDWHLRIVGWNSDTEQWRVVREDDHGVVLPPNEVWGRDWGVNDLGDAIDAAASRKLRLHVSADVYEEMRSTRLDAWLPRPPSLGY